MIRQLNRPLTVVAYISLALTATAFVDLFVLANSTADYAPWTILPPISSAFLGGGYGAGFVLFLLILRDRNWARARIGFVTVWAFTVFMTIASLMHLDKFHLDKGGSIARSAGWLWLFVYVGFATVVAVLLVVQERTPGDDPPVTRPLPRSLIAALVAQGAVLLSVGIALWVAPKMMSRSWPWVLTPLTARAIGAWCLALGIAAVQAIFERDLPRLRTAAVTYVVFAVLELCALAFYRDDVRWDHGWTWAYVVVLVSIGAVGAYGASKASARASTAG